MHKKSAIYFLSKVFFLPVLFCFSLVSCRFPGLLSNSSFDSDEVSAQKATIAMRMTVTKAAENAPTFTPAPPTVTPTQEVQCDFVWTLKQDNELSMFFESKLPMDASASTGLGVVWYGDNCIDQNTNSLVRFYPANLDITVMFEGNQEKTKQWLGDQIQLVMLAIEEGLSERDDLQVYPIRMHFVYELDGKNTYLDFDLATYRRVNPETAIHGENLFNFLFD